MQGTRYDVCSNVTVQAEDAQGQRQTPEAMACTILAYLQACSHLLRSGNLASMDPSGTTCVTLQPHPIPDTRMRADARIREGAAGQQCRQRALARHCRLD